MKIILPLILFLASISLSAHDNLFINEFLASNVASSGDEFEEYDDWIEIYNADTAAVDIAGLYLSDDPHDLQKYRIPFGYSTETMIPEKGFLMLWADHQPRQGLLHLDFKLNSDFESILLTDRDGSTILDSLSYRAQATDISFGRYPDGANTRQYFTEVTPGTPNQPGYVGITNPPLVSEPSGFYAGSFTVYIQPAQPEDQIYYTLDGSDPADTTLLYTAPVSITNSTVFRARSIRAEYVPSPIVTRDYFVQTESTLPVLMIVTNPPNLFDKSIGIYQNYTKEGRAWERKVNVQYFNDKQPQFEIDAGIRIQGNSSVNMPKKSFRLFFREGYGSDYLEYSLFKDTPVSTFQNLVLRAGYDEDLQKEHGTLLRDPLITELWRRIGYLVAHSNFARVYLNNDFWGIYNVRESINEYFTRSYGFDADADLIRYIWESWEVTYGSAAEWQDLITFFHDNNFTSDSMLTEAARRIDLNNYTDLQIYGHAAQYRSWYYGATAVRNHRFGSRWHWTIWDMDRAYTELNWNGYAYYGDNSGVYWNNLFIRRLLQNQNYKQYFINRLADLLNSVFKPEAVIPILDSLATVIEDEIPAEAERWDASTTRWYNNLEGLRDFIRQRPDIVREQTRDYFNLGNEHELSLDVPTGGGILQVNSITVSEFPWSGIYFEDVPVNVTAVAEDGFRFADWSDPGLPATDAIEIQLVGDKSLEARFEPNIGADLEIVCPAGISTGSHLPLVLRMRNRDGSINSQITADIRLNYGDQDTTIQVKKGAGNGVIPVRSSQNLSLKFYSNAILLGEKIIQVNATYPVESHAGDLPAGVIVWDKTVEHLINADLTVPQNTFLTIKAGTRVLIANQTNIFINGILNVEGTAEEPVIFTAQNWSQPWGGIELLATKANFSYCFFANAGADPAKGWMHTNRQPIIFAKNRSELILDNCFMLNSPGKALGASQSKVSVSQSLTAFVFHGGEFDHSFLTYCDSYIMNIPNDDGIFEDEDSDGFHINYLHPEINEYSLIQNCFFLTGKDDAIDQNGARLKIINCWLEGWMHEGIATSAVDTVQVFNTVVKNCEQGIEAGWSENEVVGQYIKVDHCVVVDCDVGLRIGDSYDYTSNRYNGLMAVTNTILFGNDDNIRNYINSSGLPRAGRIVISYSMTNDTDYDDLPFCITGVPQFNPDYYLMPGSAGIGMGLYGTNLGRVDSAVVLFGPLIITEIMFYPAPNQQTEDWIEIYNPQPYAQEISGWVLKDQDDQHIFEFPEGTILEAQSYLVICQSYASMHQIYPGLVNLVGDLGFGLGGVDQVRIFALAGQLVDSVGYRDSPPWPAIAQGTGYSLELRAIRLDNSLPASWQAARLIGGTPGQANSGDLQQKPADGILPIEFSLEQNYPNPFNPWTKIRYNLKEPVQVKLAIFNLLGQQVKTLVNQLQAAGVYEIEFNGADLASGIYLYRLETDQLTPRQLPKGEQIGGLAGKKVFIKKMILLK